MSNEGSVAAPIAQTPEDAAEMLAIEYLRRWYARATDLIGTGRADDVAEGRAIYHRIFTPDARIQTSGEGMEPYLANGPDGWVDVVADALAEYAATQHLIGTQLVSLQRLQRDAQGSLVEGSASMTSYLQAWHARADGHLWLFIGTYLDDLVFRSDVGWQIAAMDLQRVSDERRQLGQEG